MLFECRKQVLEISDSIETLMFFMRIIDGFPVRKIWNSEAGSSV